MKITAAYDASLLAIIAEHEEISIINLKKKYLPKPKPGIVDSLTLCFDSNLKILENEGDIQFVGKSVKYIKSSPKLQG